MKISLKFLENFFLFVAFAMVFASFILAFNGLHYLSDYFAIWGGVIALLSSLVNHKIELVAIRKELER